MRVVMTVNPLEPSYTLPTDFAAAYRSGPAWISPEEPGECPEVVAYRLRFSVPETATVRVHVTADERYELWLDGQRVGRGPERGDGRAWFFESYDLPLGVGEHVLVGRVWRLGALAPLAQVSMGPGFLLAADPPYDQLLRTGTAGWEAKRLRGYAFEAPVMTVRSVWFAGPNQVIDGATFDWGAEAGDGEGWGPVVPRREDFSTFVGIMPAHMLAPATLPAQLAVARLAGTVRIAAEGEWTDPHAVVVRAEMSSAEMEGEWQALIDGRAHVVVPPHTRRHVVLDLGDYYCAYPRLVTSGGTGSEIAVSWAEALYEDLEGRSKGQRDGVEGRTFVGITRDVILPDGGAQRRFESLWWRAGRYVQLLVETGEEALTIEDLGLEETRYPLEMESQLSMGDSRFDGFLPIALRGLQMCAHETFMDCPYYEQMMYVGDTRLEALTTYAINSDDRLPRKALAMYDRSRMADGFVQARYPSHDVQYIPPFALWWVGMVHDFASWRDDRAFVTRLMPGVRAVIDGFLTLLNDDGVLAAPAGWNFSDWVRDWPVGVPPDGADGVSGLLNWHLVYALGLAAELELWAGEPELAARFRRHRELLAGRLAPLFWEEGRGHVADALAREHFSEHTQCLALLSGMVDDERRERVAAGLLQDALLSRATIYFTHYLFETYRMLDLVGPLFERLSLWFDLPAQGFKTTPEAPEPSRSDCHGWGAHPIYHCFATLMGIRPASFGFGRVEIAPMLGPLKDVSGSLVHPRGRIEVELHVRDGHLTGTIAVPEGVSGTLCWGATTRELAPGVQQVDIT